MRLVNMGSQVNRRTQGLGPRQTSWQRCTLHPYEKCRQALHRHLWRDDRAYGLIWSWHGSDISALFFAKRQRSDWAHSRTRSRRWLS
jgi:hypothetical protein